MVKRRVVAHFKRGETVAALLIGRRLAIVFVQLKAIGSLREDMNIQRFGIVHAAPPDARRERHDRAAPGKHRNVVERAVDGDPAIARVVIAREEVEPVDRRAATLAGGSAACRDRAAW